MTSSARNADTLSLSVANCFSERIGEQGLSFQDVDAWAPAVERVHRDLVARREAGKLAFYDLPHDRSCLAACREEARRVRESAQNLLVLGIGGSALGTTAVHRALNCVTYNLLPASRRPGPRLFVCDNVDPDGFGAVLDLLDPEETAVNVISKSGGTAETSAQFLVLHRWLSEALGPERARERIVVTTDPEKGVLRKLARERGFRTLPVPPAVGGRFSVLTPVGLFPLLAVGVDAEELLAGAAHMDSLASLPRAWENPAYLFGLLHVLFLRRGRNVNVLMPYSDALREIADWFCQIWAESLGKRRNLAGEEVFVGPTPVKALGATDQHSQVQLYMEGPQDKVITFLEVAQSGREVEIPGEFPEAGEMSYLGGRRLGDLLRAEKRGTEAALATNRRPNLTIRLPRVSAHSVGQLLFLLEVATVFAGGLLDINPLDQPGVELGKELTFGLMGRKGYEARRAEVEALGTPHPCYTVPAMKDEEVTG
jgi:glucose-6-phosphate isomerase